MAGSSLKPLHCLLAIFSKLVTSLGGGGKRGRWREEGEEVAVTYLEESDGLPYAVEESRDDLGKWRETERERGGEEEEEEEEY